MDEYQTVTSPEEEPSRVARANQTLSELVTDHPMVAMAASAAVGAGVAALIIALTRERTPPHVHQVGSSTGQLYEGLQAQLRQLASKIDESLPSKSELGKAFSGLSDDASKTWSALVDGAQRTVHNVAARA